MARLAITVAAALTTACASTHYPINAPLQQVDPAAGYRTARAFASEPDDDVFVHVSLSGGGARAAALGFGVLTTLQITPFTWNGRSQTLLGQVDMLTGLSGGSMLAAWVALHGVEGLNRFEAAFLDRPLQSSFVSAALSPRNLWRIQSPRFGRSDVLSEQLDEWLYKGATFSGLASATRKPFVLIHATDIVTGLRFEFTQDHFDFICSNLDAVPLARAVAASSAAPLVLSPVTFWNYAQPVPGGGCGEPPLRSVLRGTPGGELSEQAAGLESLRATSAGALERPFLHLIDGGLSDNVGARGTVDYVAQFGGVVEGTRSAGYRKVRRVVFILVNAETSARSNEDRSADVPGMLRSALALADIPINRNSLLSLGQKRMLLGRWRSEVAATHAAGDFSVFAPDVDFFLIEITLQDEPDLATRERLQAIPTSLELPRADVDLLLQHARRAVRRNPEFQRLVDSLR